MLKVCLNCQATYPTKPRDGGRCEPCRKSYQANQPTTKQRGLSGEWVRLAKTQIQREPWCAFCGATEDLTADHVNPRSLGGTAADGLRTLCRGCNSKRGNRGVLPAARPGRV